MDIIFKKDVQNQIFDGQVYGELYRSVMNNISKGLNAKPELIKEYSKGTSFGIKRAVIFGKIKLFIKIGEKVALENKIYENKFYKNNKIFLNKIENYCSNPDILVLPFYEGKNFDEFLFDKKFNLSDKIEKIQNILNIMLDSFWLQNINRGSDNLVWVEDYITGRLNRLKKDIYSVKIGRITILVEDFLNMPIVYSFSDKKYGLPSINEMTKNITSLFYEYKPQLTSCVTADFQPPNIIIKGNEFKHIDLSNSEVNGDIAIDIGKFFNFINRFYRVSFLRDRIRLNDSLKPKFRIDNGSLLLNVESESPHYLSHIFSQIEETFSLRVANTLGDFNLIDRVKLYKFVINLITVRRHLNYGGLADTLFANLIDSYAEITDKIINI